MAKISALKGFSSTRKHSLHGTPYKQPHKREHAWVDVDDDDDDDLEVKSASRPPSRGADHGPRKKPRMFAPPGLPPGKDSIQTQRKHLPIYAGAPSSLSTSHHILQPHSNQPRQARCHPHNSPERCHRSHRRDWFWQDDPYVSSPPCSGFVSIFFGLKFVHEHHL